MKFFNIHKPVKKSKIEISPLFNVEKFNQWFNNKDNNSYANPGIFLRLDKLSPSMIFDYFTFYGVENVQHELYGEYYHQFRDFEENIRKDWLIKINNK